MKTNYGEVFEKELIKEEDLGFGVFEPPEKAPPLYNLRLDFKNGKWGEFSVRNDPFIVLRIEAGIFHYGHEWFEGMVAHMTKDRRCLLFRAKENAKRAEKSSQVLCMEPVPKKLFLEGIKAAVKLNAAYLPRYGTGGRLYIRPFLIGTNPQLGLGESRDFTFIVFCYPVGNYYPTGLKPMKLYCSPAFDRVAQCSTGQAKAGGNYAASYRSKQFAKSKGCGEYLYLDPTEHKFIAETGSANFFALRENKVYVTPDEPSVLQSITNDSLAAIAKELMGFTIEKRKLTWRELLERGCLSEFLEAGLCGTAARLTPVESIIYEDERQALRIERIFPKVREGNAPWCQELYARLKNLQHGDEEDRWGWTMEVD